MIPICEIVGNPKWIDKLYLTRDKYHTIANNNESDPEISNKFRLMGDRANALANKLKMIQIGDQKMKHIADRHYRMLTDKQYPERVQRRWGI